MFFSILLTEINLVYQITNNFIVIFTRVDLMQMKFPKAAKLLGKIGALDALS